jgi:U3 small nucleolar RNA-associated protein 10
VPLIAYPGAGDAELEEALVALCNAVTDDGDNDALLKRLNMDVLMHTRSDDVRVRIFALRCASALWLTHGSKLVGAFSRVFFFLAPGS